MAEQVTGWRSRIVGQGDEAPDQLMANPRNWRIHPKAQQDALAGALDQVGWVQRVIVNRQTGHLVDGHLRVELALSRGEPTVPVEYVDLTPEEEGLVLASLDPIAAMAGQDDEKLRQLIAEVEFDSKALEEALEALAPEPRSGLTDPDDVPAVDEADVYVKTGDLWLLGEHRLLCGDSAKSEDVARLMAGTRPDCILTDPPYGINLDTDYQSMGSGSSKAVLRGVKPKTYRPVINDDRPFDARPVLEAIGDVPEQFWFGADYYRRTLSDDDMDGSWLVWDKRNEASDAGFGSAFELIWSRQRHKRDLLRFYFFGAFGAEGANRLHPTQKPTKMLSEIIERYTKTGAVIWDGFAGSGSTIMAAEQTGRRCYAVEIDPRYVQVAIERWQSFTGKEAVRG